MGNTRENNETAAPFAVVSVDVGGTKIAAGLMEYAVPGERPRLLFRDTVPTLAAEGGPAVLNRIKFLVAKMAEAYGRPIAAVGVATAGRVNAKTGAIDFANEIMPGWTGQPVAAAVSESAGVPCAVLNDVQGHALGEARWGVAHGCANCLMVAPGTGLGGSIIVDGKVVRGARGFAGEIGHTLHPAAKGIPCSCGGESHIESIASGSGIEATYVKLGGEQLSGAEISARANEGEELAAKVVGEAGYALGEAIAAWVNMLDPEMIILSGSVCKAGPLWASQLKAGFIAQAPSTDTNIPIVEATLGGDAPLYGAAEHACDAFNLK